MRTGRARHRQLDEQQPQVFTPVHSCQYYAALFVLNGLRERGISVPGECSVVGYDDIYLATHTVPPLTTMRVDRQLMAREGVAKLIERIAEPDLSPRYTRVAVNLVKRQSVSERHLAPTANPRAETFG